MTVLAKKQSSRSNHNIKRLKTGTYKQENQLDCKYTKYEKMDDSVFI